ncbi:MAG: DUF2946 family protein [Paracoccus sp. (in: a-proteobacteria)]
MFLHAALRRAGRWAMVLPFLFFAGFSQGTMFAAASEGGVRIVLCTGDGMVDAVMAPDGQVHLVDSPDHDSHPNQPPCDWALHGQPGLADAAVSVDPPLIREIAPVYAIDIPLHLRRAEVLTPAARGPPPLI